MGAVYEGENSLIRRRVAIKVMHGGALRNSEMSARFEREAQIVNRINSEHVIEVLDLGHLPDKDPFIVMEYLEGQTLAERISSRTSVTAQELVPLLCQVLLGLQSAHSAGVIHRDIKPDNIFLLSNRAGQNDFVKILDFGISKIGEVGDESGLTHTGATLGTPGYMAPEQIGSGNRVQPPADLYAVGVILYRALTGRPPFSAERINELLTQIAQGGAAPACEVDPSIDPGLSRIIERSMLVNPADRYGSAEDMRTALLTWLDHNTSATASGLSTDAAHRKAPDTLTGLQPLSGEEDTSLNGAHTLPPPHVSAAATTPLPTIRRNAHWIVLATIAAGGVAWTQWQAEPSPIGSSDGIRRQLSATDSTQAQLERKKTAPAELRHKELEDTPPEAYVSQALPPVSNTPALPKGPAMGSTAKQAKPVREPTPPAPKPPVLLQPPKAKATQKASSPRAIPPEKKANSPKAPRRSARRSAKPVEKLSKSQVPTPKARKTSPKRTKQPSKRIDWGY